MEYLGAFLLQLVSNLSMAQSVQDNIPDDIKDYVYDQAPYLFKGFRPFKNVPRMPFVKLLHVNFNKNLVECAEQGYCTQESEEGPEEDRL